MHGADQPTWKVVKAKFLFLQQVLTLTLLIILVTVTPNGPVF